MLLTRIPLLDELLQRHSHALGSDFGAYRNHAYRVANFCAALASPTAAGADEDSMRRISIAAAFHDLGIWTDHTFDYLAPSERLAERYLAEIEGTDAAGEIVAMIDQHHKITPCRSDERGLVEAFRRADWADVSRGAIASGLAADVRREVFAAFPSAGFHKRLMQLSCSRLISHPWSPLPMLRW